MTIYVCPCCGYDLAGEEIIETKTLYADPRGLVQFRGRNIALTLAEKQVLISIAKERGRAVSRAILHERIGSDAKSNVLEVLINRLRSKLGDPSSIETIRGQGWRWAA